MYFNPIATFDGIYIKTPRLFSYEIQITLIDGYVFLIIIVFSYTFGHSLLNGTVPFHHIQLNRHSAAVSQHVDGFPVTAEKHINAVGLHILF